MEIIKTATDWAKAEVFSSLFFILFGVLFISATIGFWQIGKTDVAKAYIYPTLVSGILLLMVGVGILYANKVRETSFVSSYQENPTEFIDTELVRTEKIIGEYQTAVFTVIPFIIIAAALIIFFLQTPVWRAIGITTIALMSCVMLIDSNASKRVKDYHEALIIAKQSLNQ